MPKPEDHFHSESAHEQAVIYLNKRARLPATIRRRKNLNPHLNATLLTMKKVARNCLQKKKQKLHQWLKDCQVKPNEVSNQTVALGEGISQISESSCQIALASISSANPVDVANTVEGYDNIEDDMQEYVNANFFWKMNIQLKVSQEDPDCCI